MSFFKAYDMRGTFGTDFDLATVRRVGAALPAVVPGRRWLVGRDCRVTSEAVSAELINGLRAAGVNVTDLGRCTTPMVYFFTAQDGFDGSVMVTASHNPPGDNGLKVSKAGALPVGYADGLDRVERLVSAASTDSQNAPTAPQSPTDTLDDARARYLAWQRARIESGVADLAFAIDCSNGMASSLVRELYPNAEILNGEEDGRFPNHSPNPLKAEAREQLAAYVRAHHLDCGVIFDGDADRAMFVDETGAFVQPDYLIPAITRATCRALGVETRQTVIHDVRTSRGAIETLREMGCDPVMVPVGHAFAKPILRARRAICGGELAGHYYFGEFFGCDSGLLAASRALAEIARAKARGETFSQMMAPVCGRYANSGELNFRVADKAVAIRRVLETAEAKLPRERTRATIDGIRLEYDAGWVNVRASNTEPFLRLILECDTVSRLAEWEGIFKEVLSKC